MAPQETDTGSLAGHYIHTGGGGNGQMEDVFGHVYVGSPYVQSEHGHGKFLACLFRAVNPLAIRGSGALSREALKTVTQILADIGKKHPENKM